MSEKNLLQVTPWVPARDVDEMVRYFVEVLGFKAWVHAWDRTDMMRVLVGVVWLLFAVGGGCAVGQGPAWVELTGRGASVRAIVPAGEDCPVARAGGRRVVLQVREGAPWAAGAFPVKACAAAVPAGVATVEVAGQRLRVRVGVGDRPTRIVVIGDTGCRRSAKELQDCSADWPFAKIAAAAAARRPDLVVHVGDYYYREICADGKKHCESWENWRADFFEPAGPLLGAAPWLLARGNHEMCGRASEGWFRFLDAGPSPLPCMAGEAPAESAAFAVRLKGLTLVSVDSADVEDAMAVDKRMTSVAGRMAGVGPLQLPGKHEAAAVWVVTHKPPYIGGLMGKKDDPEKGVEPALSGVDVVVAGHVHMFAGVDFKGLRPAELIVGDSGTALMATAAEMQTKVDPQALVEGDAAVDGLAAHYGVKGRFGYLLLERTGGAREWRGTLYGVADEVLAHCVVGGRAIRCEAPAAGAGSAGF